MEASDIVMRDTQRALDTRATVEERRSVEGEMSEVRSAVMLSAVTSGNKLVLRNVSKCFQSRASRAPTRVLEDVNLDLAGGHVLSLLGPSGCGKTTLLHLIAGLQPCSGGEIWLGDECVESISRERMVVFQQPALFPWKTVLDNVVIGAEVSGGLSRSEGKAKAREVLKRVGLEGQERLYPYELSGGMRQRVQIARALFCSPRLLLMDEPFGALDAQTRLVLQELVLSLWSDRSSSVVFVTHDIDEAILVGDRLAVLRGRPGRVVDCFDVDLPSPRGFKSLTHPSFIAAKERALEVMHRRTQ